MLRRLPPLPATPALAQANSILAAARGRPQLDEQMRLLLEPLQSQSLGVRSMALQVKLHQCVGNFRLHIGMLLQGYAADDSIGGQQTLS